MKNIRRRSYQFLIVSALIFLQFGCSKTDKLSLTSPNEKIEFSLHIDQKRLFYSVSIEGVEVVEKSPLGIERNDVLFFDNLEFVSSESSKIDESYELKTGKRLSNKVAGKQTDFTFRNTETGKSVILQTRAYDEGVAFRYAFTEKSDSLYSIKAEKTGFKMPLDGRAWIMPYDTISMYTPSYETFYTNGAAVGTTSPNSEGWSYPALFHVKDKWVLISESGLNETYCATHLEGEAVDGLYTVRFPEKTEAQGLYSEFPSNTLPWASPWRVLILGNNSGDIIESSLITHLAESSKIKDDSWVKPGRSSWSWWSDHSSPRSFTALKNFVDLSVEMGWEYSLVDANWDLMKGGNINQLLDYANAKGIGLWLWYNSGGEINKVTERPRDIMFDPITRKAEFAKLKEWGVKGVKIDFFQSDKQEVIKLYLDILRDAADNQIMVNFHGCTLPRGWERTYPNLMTMEAVRGAENYDYDKNYPERAVWHNTIYPFTRNVVGSADYTPVTFSHLTYPHLTTNAHELALSIVYESGLLHFADKVEAYTSLNPEIKAFLKDLPVTWDETKYIAGEPGKYVVLARKKGDKWYVGGINGQPTPQEVMLDRKLFNVSKLVVDGEGAMSLAVENIDNNSDLIKIEMNKSGGFVAF